MAIELFSNRSSTTVGAGGIDNSSTSLLVTSSAAPFPQTGNFRILVDNEIMLVTAVPDGTHFTVTRGAEGTTAASHTAGAIVSHILTSGSISQFRADTNQQGTNANLPAAGYAGRLYQTTDGTFLYQDTGSVWNAYGPIWPNMGALASGNYSWANQGSATATWQGGTLFLSNSGTTTNHNIVYRAMTAPYTVTINFILWGCPTGSFHSFSLGFYDTASTKWSNFQMAFTSSAPVLWAEKWNSPTSYSGEYTHLNFNNTYLGGHLALPNWLRLTDDGTTNRTYQYSWDGLSWLTLQTIGRTDFLTPNAVGVSIRKDASDSSLKAVRLLSWYQTSP